MTILFEIAIKNAKRGPMRLVESAQVTVDLGLVGDVRGAGGPNQERQVTLISLAQWYAVCAKLGKDLPWTTRRANLCVRGFDFRSSDVGMRVGIGPEVVLEVTGETTPCSRMDEAYSGLKQALAATESMWWPAGVTCRVVQGGTINIGNHVEV